MVLSELTNKELKSILRENDVRNYSKLNKKGLLKKVTQLIKVQNGGSKKSGKVGNKKDTLMELIGGEPTTSATPPAALTSTPPDALPSAPTAAPPAALSTNLAPSAPPAKNSEPAALSTNNHPAPSAPPANNSEPSAPPLGSNPSSTSTGNKYLNAYYNPKDPKNVRLVNPEFGSNPPEQSKNKKNKKNNAQNNSNTNKPNDGCGACSIL